MNRVAGYHQTHALSAYNPPRHQAGRVYFGHADENRAENLRILLTLASLATTVSDLQPRPVSNFLYTSVSAGEVSLGKPCRNSATKDTERDYDRLCAFQRASLSICRVLWLCARTGVWWGSWLRRLARCIQQSLHPYDETDGSFDFAISSTSYMAGTSLAAMIFDKTRWTMMTKTTKIFA